MNILGNCRLLTDKAGIVSNSGPSIVLGVSIREVLVGELRITGITNLDGSPAAWVLPSGSCGYYPAPGAGLASVMWHESDSTEDAGKCFVSWITK